MILMVQPVNLGRRFVLGAALLAAMNPSYLFAADNPSAELDRWNWATNPLNLDKEEAKKIAMTSELDFSKQIDHWVSFVKRTSVKNTKFAEGFVQHIKFPITEENIKFAKDNPDTKYAAGVALEMPIRADLIDFCMEDDIKNTILAKNYTSREDFPKVFPLIEETVDYYINNPNSKLAIALKESKGFKDGVNRILKQRALKQKGEWKDIKVTDVTEEPFEQEVLKQKGLVLVDFWATWCAPCKTLAPRLQGIVNDYNGLLKGVKVDFDQNLSLVTKYKIENVPTLALFKNGQPIEWIIGSQSNISIASKVEKHLN